MKADLLKILDENIFIYDQYGQPIKSLRSKIQLQLKKKLGLDNSKTSSNPLVVSGHQVEFFHPGILSKEILGSQAALQLGGSYISIILDHDPHDLVFSSPQIEVHDHMERIRKVSYLLNAKSQSKDSISNKKSWVDFLRQIPGNLEKHFDSNTMKQIDENISFLIENSGNHLEISDYITASRLYSLKNLNLTVYPLKVSEMVNLEGWKEYCDLVNDNLERFIEAHNSSLDEYRKLHHIKNHAQPVPNLAPHESPFWVITNGKRVKARHDDIKKETLYPRAITLSIFMRLFMSDIFIHGKGGARYDQVTNSIIRKFFNVTPSAFLVKTASLQIPVKLGSLLAKYKSVKNIDDWLVRYRFFLFHPDKIEGADPELVKHRNQLIKKFHESKHDNAGEKKAIHNELEENRIQILNQLGEFEDRLFKERDEIKKYTGDRNVLTDRTFPYFFYDLQELLNDPSYDVVKYK
jgi:hypothetical protein